MWCDCIQFYELLLFFKPVDKKVVHFIVLGNEKFHLSNVTDEFWIHTTINYPGLNGEWIPTAVDFKTLSSWTCV
jgi:hypothetical protein